MLVCKLINYATPDFCQLSRHLQWNDDLLARITIKFSNFFESIDIKIIFVLEVPPPTIFHD